MHPFAYFYYGTLSAIGIVILGVIAVMMCGFNVEAAIWTAVWFGMLVAGWHMDRLIRNMRRRRTLSRTQD